MSVALWLLSDTGWQLYARTPLLRYLQGALRHATLQPLLVWLRDRLWTRQTSAWLDRPGSDDRWSWQAEHPAWLEGVTLYLAPLPDSAPDAQTVHLQLWHDLPTPISVGHRITVLEHPTHLAINLGVGDPLQHHPLPAPMRLLAIEIQYRRRMP